MIPFERVTSAFIMPMTDMMNIPPKDIERILKSRITEGLAHYILEHIDNLPAKIAVRDDICTGGKEYRLTVNIISDEEIRRLSSIEDEWNQLMFTCKYTKEESNETENTTT